MFFTPALAAAECAKPGPPVHAYEAPTLMIEPGVPAVEVAAGELAGAEERAVQRDVDDGAPRVRRHVLGRHREVGRRVVDQHAGQAEAGSAASNAAAICSGSRMSHATVVDRARRARPTASWPASRCSGLRLAITIDAPRRANSVAIALPEAGAAAGDEHGGAVEGAGGQRAGARRRAARAGRGVGGRAVLTVSSRCSAGSRPSARAARNSAMSSDRVMKVWRDQLLGHRRPDLGLRQVADAPAGPSSR